MHFGLHTTVQMLNSHIITPVLLNQVLSEIAFAESTVKIHNYKFTQNLYKKTIPFTCFCFADLITDKTAIKTNVL